MEMHGNRRERKVMEAQSVVLIHGPLVVVKLHLHLQFNSMKKKKIMNKGHGV